jgi:hypothetical protein
MAQTFAAVERWLNVVQIALCRPVPVLFSGSRFGANPAPCGSALFCFDFVALRFTVSVYDGPSVNAELGTWEPAHSLASHV